MKDNETNTLESKCIISSKPAYKKQCQIFSTHKQLIYKLQFIKYHYVQYGVLYGYFAINYACSHQIY